MRAARRLALGRLISLSGGSAAYIALVAAIYGSTHSAVWVFSGTAEVLPAFGLGSPSEVRPRCTPPAWRASSA